MASKKKLDPEAEALAFISSHGTGVRVCKVCSGLSDHQSKVIEALKRNNATRGRIRLYIEQTAGLSVSPDEVERHIYRHIGKAVPVA